MRKRRNIEIFILLLAFAVFSRLVYDKPDFKVGMFWDALTMTRSLLHVILAIFWCYSIQRRILSRPIRKYLTEVGLLIIFWLLCRTFKWYFTPSFSLINRMCWYAYYIPMILIPMIGAFLIDFVGKPEGFEASFRKKYLCIPALCLIALVFTNDWHELVFRFPQGIIFYDDIYEYNFVYYLIFAWIVILSLYFAIMLSVKAHVPGRPYQKYFPILILCVGVVFEVLYGRKILQADMVAVNSVIMICLLECAIQIGLISSNTGYEELLREYTDAIWITDDECRVYYQSNRAGTISKDMMLSAKREPVVYGINQLCSAKIKGGYAFWMINVAKIQNAIKYLEEAKKELSQSNELLEAELRLKEQELRIAEQNRIYNQITKDVAVEIDKISVLLDCDRANEQKLQENLKEVCVLGAFVKRYSNLLLLKEDKDYISSRELAYCLKESGDYLKAAGMQLSFEATGECELSADMAAVFYRSFEKYVEAFYKKAEAVFVLLLSKEEEIELRLQIGGAPDLEIPETKGFHELGGKTTVSTNDTDITIRMVYKSRRKQ